MRFLMKLAAAAFATFALTAQPAAAQGTLLNDVIAAGKIRVGINLGGEPVGFRDGSNNPVGYDVDVAQKLADALGVKLEVVELNSASRIPMLQSKQVDLVIANMTATLERAKSIDFSVPYLKTGIKMVVQKGSGIKTLKDLDGKKVVIVRGSTSEQLVAKAAPKATVVLVEAFAPEGMLLMRQKRADAAFEDSSLIDFAAKQSPDLLEAGSEQYTSDPFCFGVRNGDLGFALYLDMFVSNYVSSGAYHANYRKWWGTDGAALTSVW